MLDNLTLPNRKSFKLLSQDSIKKAQDSVKELIGEYTSAIQDLQRLRSNLEKLRIMIYKLKKADENTSMRGDRNYAREYILMRVGYENKCIEINYFASVFVEHLSIIDQKYSKVFNQLCKELDIN